jgi:hypothetical protein
MIQALFNDLGLGPSLGLNRCLNFGSKNIYLPSSRALEIYWQTRSAISPPHYSIIPSLMSVINRPVDLWTLHNVESVHPRVRVHIL